VSRAPIAVVGTACRLPGAPDPAAFWRRLAAGDDFVTEVPRERWDVDAYFQEGAASPGKMFTRWGAFLDRVDLFDPRFFRITEREAVFMDPQQRLLLETAWDALADAGRPGDSMAGSRTGVFVGISSYDYGTLIMEDLRLMSAFSGLGSALSVAANRLSYCLDLRGPSLSVDTACSSSLVALHLACESLARGESDTALVGGVNVVLRPNMMVGFSQAAMMARDGRCKTFDARADGFVRAEGSVVMVLKPLEAAIRDRDRIHAVIRGSATNQDGLTNGIAAPSGRAQTAVIRAALESAGVEPCSVSYVEAHGTGTSIGDAIEVGALRTAYLAGRPERESLTVGSTKTNLGHTEAASGLVGVLKLILSLAHEALPKHLHLETPNPQLGLHDGRLRIPTEVLSWPRTGRPRLAGVSAFGFGGTNAHAILEEPPAATPSRLKARSVHVLPVHAKTETQLRAQAARLKERVQSDPGAIAALVHSAATAASRFPQRGVCVGRDAKELAAGLDAIASGSSSAHAFAGAGRSAPRLAWIFSGQGTQRWGMGRVDRADGMDAARAPRDRLGPRRAVAILWSPARLRARAQHRRDHRGRGRGCDEHRGSGASRRGPRAPHAIGHAPRGHAVAAGRCARGRGPHRAVGRLGSDRGREHRD
jgi:iturin family lipopeptide synthetase A